MIHEIDPRILLGVGFVLLLIGFALPALMIMQMIPSTFLLNFLAYASSFLGLMLGMIGSIMIGIRNRKRDR